MECACSLRACVRARAQAHLQVQREDVEGACVRVLHISVHSPLGAEQVTARALGELAEALT